ncbi:MAG: FAD-dependent oxidoreductase [Candidatus Omnitrophica bacterium]|nr:FAD-dependent oxidoreductase [Candidatus Omnitrophota bacterium]
MEQFKYKVEIPDMEYWQKIIKCQYACPVLTPAGRYVTSISEGDYEKAYDFARLPNPFVYVCGRVCDHPCETACRRGDIDEPISIRAMKRVATDHHSLSLGHAHGHIVKEKNNRRVAVLGAGPAGLSCAHDLARLGYSVTIFESSPVAGGMLYLGLPEYRLSRDIIRLEVDAIINLGAELKTNKAIGRDFSLPDLKQQGFEAVFIAIGAHKSKDLRMEGLDLDGVLKGVDFLLNINLGYKVDLGKKVIVIGGGNVAMDVARSAMRKVATSLIPGGLEEMREAVEVARLALRRGAREVHLVCLESRKEMPAHPWEVEEAEKEGIIIHPSLGPKRIVGAEGKVVGLETIDVQSVFDSDGRFNPAFKAGTEKVIEGTSVILAIGQASDLSFITKEDGIEMTRRGTIAVNEETLAATASGIYAGGDVAFGPRNVIQAVADGQKAARAIDYYLKGRREQKKIAKFTVLKDHRMSKGYDAIERQKVPVLPLDRRIGIAEVELGFPDNAAKEEGKRCLKCFINTIFDSSKCILCGGCVDVCPEYCLKMVRINNIEGDENLVKLIGKKGGVQTAMLKDETKCIRCGLCARRCPTGTITMEMFEIERQN